MKGCLASRRRRAESRYPALAVEYGKMKTAKYTRLSLGRSLWSRNNSGSIMRREWLAPIGLRARAGRLGAPPVIRSSPPAKVKPLRLILMAALFGTLAGCETPSTVPPAPPNRPPVAVGSIPAVIVQVDRAVTVDAAEYFTDPDGDGLAYAASSSDSSRVTVSVAGSTVTAAGVVRGAATVTVTASDGDGATTQQAFVVTVRDDRDVLAVLYRATDGPNWQHYYNWLSDAPLSEWYGIKVNVAGRVVALSLDRNGLYGSIPPEIGGLAALERLSLYENNYVVSSGQGVTYYGLTGPIPPEIGNLTALRYLRLSSNLLTGPIPPQIGDLAALDSLDLGYNGGIAAYGLTGPIPPELANLTALRYLRLSGNDLSGPIPPEIGNLVALRRLRLSGNELSGPIPQEIGNLAALEGLHLEGNALTGPIPPVIGRLSALSSLWLDGNAISGPIPSSVGGLSALKYLGLSANALSGPIPPEIGDLAVLEVLYLGDNAFSGPIPPQMADLAALEELDLSNNPDLCTPDSPRLLAWLDMLNVTPPPRCAGGG